MHLKGFFYQFASRINHYPPPTSGFCRLCTSNFMLINETINASSLSSSSPSGRYKDSIIISLSRAPSSLSLSLSLRNLSLHPRFFGEVWQGISFRVLGGLFPSFVSKKPVETNAVPGGRMLSKL